MSSDSNFDYFISQKTEVAVVTMIGSLSKANAEQIESCVKAIESLNSTFLIFNMRDVTEIRENFVRPFANIQMLARKRGQMRISGLKPEHRAYLSQYGLVRQIELTNNLNDAILEFMKSCRPAA
jgi:anti-anti-sigma regulatory factor